MLEQFQNLFAKIQLNKPKIAIVGDLMIDEYYECSMNTISPEFPLPIIKSTNLSPNISTAGGGGNLFNQFKNLNVDVSLFGFIDEYSIETYKNINTNNCVLINGQIPIKRRYYQGTFPLCRWDVECENYNLGNQLKKYQNKLYDNFKKLYNEFDVILFSDYNKGIFKNFNKSWVLHPNTIVDPKTIPISRWKNCRVFKPNKKEAELLSGKTQWKEQCDYFQNKINCENVIITLGAEGICGKNKEQYFYYENTRKTNCESVIGGGDCAVSWIALGLATGLDIIKTAELSYEAGAIYVQKKYNEPITKNDIIKRFDPILAKYVNIDDIKNRNYKLVMCNGCFDILHSGHLETFKFAKSKGDKLIVAVNDDVSVAKLKAGRPINKLEDRLKMLANLEAVDFVISFSEDTPLNLIKMVNPDIVVKGSEYQIEDVVGYGIVEIILAPMIKNYSTSNIIKHLDNHPS